MAVAAPASAEKLTFDHRNHPGLKAVLDGGDPGMIDFDASNPRYVVDLIAVKGRSARDWTEALEIIARTPTGKIRTARDWAAEIQGGAVAGCNPAVTTLAEDAISITFERLAPACPAARAETMITRIVQGKRSLFLLSVLVKGVPDAGSRQQWLALLESAHLD
ncbi:hypothetical protein [Novosphingobium kunmingense]|uniref:hypothetical protein n=1 Tax=Novosphingobium kunmingense TaxID=1211806 RepID=UPI0018E20055|nr:hypothetical protein [Novosphingobium kunmingense]